MVVLVVSAAMEELTAVLAGLQLHLLPYFQVLRRSELLTLLADHSEHLPVRAAGHGLIASVLLAELGVVLLRAELFGIYLGAAMRVSLLSSHPLLVRGRVVQRG